MNVSRSLFAVVALVGGLSTGCHARVYGHAHVRYVEPAPVVFVDAPDLVYVEPGVYVVRDCDHAVYYIDGYYYSYRGGSWYHAAHWSDPWISVNINVVPRVVVHRDHRTYVHYRGHAGAQVIRDERPRRHAANPSQGGGHSASQPTRQASPSHGNAAPEHHTRSAEMNHAPSQGKVSSAPQPAHATPARNDHDPKEMRIKTDADIGQRSKDDGPSKPSKHDSDKRASASSPSPMKPAAQPSKSKSSPAVSAPSAKKAPTKKVKKKK